MAKNKLYDEHKIGDTIGVFVGSIRRTKYSNYGLTTQIFGENGENADYITALHLTKFLNVFVKVSIWGIKTSEGVSMKDKEGKYPQITSFIAKIKRPRPSDTGQTALFFAENGENADQANILNESKYVDALVSVQIQLADENVKIKDIETDIPLDDLENAGDKLSEKERIKLEKERKNDMEAEDLLLKTGFFLIESVYKTIGSDNDYKKWTLTQPCCFNDQNCDNSELKAYQVLMGQPYKYIPLCKKHQKVVLSPQEDDTMYINLLNLLKINKLNWVLSKIKTDLNIKLEDPVPVNKMKNYLLDKGLVRYLPDNYNFYLK